MKLIVVALMTLAIVLAGCQSTEPTPTPTEIPPTAAPTETPRPTRPPTHTPTAQPTATPAPTEVATAVPATPTEAVSDVWVNSTNGLNLRAEPNVTATVTLVVSFGQHLTAIGQPVGPDASTVIWQNVRTDAGQTGWVAAAYQGTPLLSTTNPAGGAQPIATTPAVAQPTATAAPPAASGDVWVIATTGLNLRTDPKATATLITNVPFGQHLTVLGPQSAADSDGIAWQQVRTDAGQTGWVAAVIQGTAYLSTAQPTPASTAPAPATPVPTTPGGGVPANVSGAILELFNRINALRAQHGLSPYAWNDQLAAAAHVHSVDMARTGRIDHTGSDGSTPAQRIKAAGYLGGATTEDIYGGEASVDDVWDFWSTDPFHLPTLISTQYTDIGIDAFAVGRNIFYTADLGGP